MKLFELEEGSRNLAAVVAALSPALGAMERVGGKRRVYQVGNMNAACFLVGGSSMGIGLAWPRNTREVRTIYMWREFDASRSPDYAIDIPAFGNFSVMVKPIVELLKNPKTGKIDITLGESHIFEDAKVEDMFVQAATQMFGDKASALTPEDLVKVAQQVKAPVPASIAKLRVPGTNTFDLSSKNPAFTAQTGKRVTDPAPNTDPMLAKAATAKNMAATGHIVLFGRNPDGTFFEIPGFADYAAKLERILTDHVRSGDGETTMEEQYDDLREKVRLVASGSSNYIKSLLVTGAPSSGKTRNVMDVIKGELGLREGEDYIVKKGKISTAALWRTLIEQIDGMLIFDDCDSVVKEKDAKNILKGALDTDPVREISYDVQGLFNTGVMSREDRISFVDAMSRVLRGEPQKGDIERFEHYIKDMPDEEEPDEDDVAAQLARAKGLPDPRRLAHVQKYLARHLPNKIDFRGRIIFVSNMEESEWDSAIITRAFTINMAFSSGEMLDFIEKILPHLGSEAENPLPIEQKKEVLDYIRELHVAGKLRKPINFRLVQQAFDLRLTSNWRKMVAKL